ncbi:hypothetical protein QWJ26_23500 [Streptomyces sp. CSDS2]|nr:hypothetical protein [Streptomyces sp. CSDS2]MDN3262715.1 hypothetical protein [Streptomyces sp. CSDS2]
MRHDHVLVPAEKKAGVHIAQMAKNDPPKLSVHVVSGCYKVPDGQKVEHF